MTDRPLLLDRTSNAKVLGGVAKQYREQGRLTRAVAPDEADLLSITNGKGDRLENAACAYLYFQISNYEHLSAQ
jgi:hypothetical protein